MNTYLIASESYKLLDKEVESIINKDSIIIKYDLRNSTLNEVINEAGYVSLTGDKKTIVVSCDELFKSDDDDNSKNEEYIKILDKYFDNANPDVTLIFKSFILPDKRKKMYKLFSKRGVVSVLPSLNKMELTNECMEILKLNGYQIDYKTANYITENSFYNYDIMLSEIDKIYVLVPKKNLSISDLVDVVSKGMNDNVFSYITDIINRDLEKAITDCKSFETLKIEPNMVLVMLYKEFMIYYHLLNKVSPREIQSFYHKEDWQMNKYLMNKDNYTLKEIKKIIIKLNNYDYKLKMGKIPRSVLLGILALDLCC